MKQNQISSSAQQVALQRAAHQLLDTPKIFDDPLALRILGRENASELQAAPHRVEVTPLSSYMRAFISLRSRYAEDELAQCVRGGVRQYVILGAGLDTFAYRNPYPAGTLRVFEVDHPVTQAWKRERLKEGGIAIPDNLTFVALDFENQTLADGLREASYDPGIPTFFSWLGVTMYLSPEAVTSTLRFIASAAVGSVVVFDYLVSPSLLTPDQRVTFDKLAHWADLDGEPWRTFFDPESLKEKLLTMGFGQAENMEVAEINARYFMASSDEFHIGSLGRAVKATV